MNEEAKKLFTTYQEELQSLNMGAEQQDDYLGMPGAQGLSDTTDAMKHASWMITEMMDEDVEWSEHEADRWFGFIQGILWTTKMRGVIDLNTESMLLNGPVTSNGEQLT